MTGFEEPAGEVSSNRLRLSLLFPVVTKYCCERSPSPLLEMCERSLYRAGYVGSLLNLQSPDSFYFSNLRPNGGQLAALPPISYPRGALPWATTPTSCAPAQPAGATAFSSFSQPYLAGSGPLGLQPLGAKDGSEEQAKFYTPDAAAGPEERGRARPPFIPESSLAPAAAALKAAKYDYTGLGRVAPGSSTLLEGTPCSAGFKDDAKGPLNLNMTMQAGVASCLRPSLPDGKGWPGSPSKAPGPGWEVGCWGECVQGGKPPGRAGNWERAGLTWVGAVLQACRGGRPRGGPERSGNPTQSSRLRNWRTNSFSTNSSTGRSARNCPTG